MLIAIIGLSIALLIAGAFIFYLLKVLKNTFQTCNYLFEEYCVVAEIAYDNQYYPATVIAKLEFGAPQESKIVDWSLYETQKIIGFTFYLPVSVEEYYGKALFQSLDKKYQELLNQSMIVKHNAIVYAPKEGEWAWKLA